MIDFTKYTDEIFFKDVLLKEKSYIKIMKGQYYIIYSENEDLQEKYSESEFITYMFKHDFDFDYKLDENKK